MSSFLLDYDFSSFYLSTHIEFIWGFLKDLFHLVTTLFAPRSKYHSSSRPQWFSPDICHQLNKVHSFRNSCRKDPSPLKLSHLLTVESKLQSDIACAWDEYESDLVHNFALTKDARIYKYY